MDSTVAQLQLGLAGLSDEPCDSAPVDLGEARLAATHSRNRRRDAQVRRIARDLAPGAIVAARVSGQEVAVARLGSGRLVVVADACPHDGGRISDGFVEGERLVCARHGWELEARDGRCERVCKLRE